MYADMLESVGFNVMQASDGEKAIGLLHKIVNPQLIILDVMMPRMDGIETCCRMRKMQGLRPCPILFLTALDSSGTLLECLRAGGDDYVMKSAPMAEFCERIDHWARRGYSEDTIERREKAIRELEEISGQTRGMQDCTDIADEQATIGELVCLIEAQKEAIQDEADDLYRFGYLVGLVESRFGNLPKNNPTFNRILGKIAYKTNFVARREIESLLYNHERTIDNCQYKLGWKHGRVDAGATAVCPNAGAAARGEEKPASN
jgi:DNA-binding response OmpR family regulator